jgi:hypothetical protein
LIDTTFSYPLSKNQKWSCILSFIKAQPLPRVTLGVPNISGYEDFRNNWGMDVISLRASHKSSSEDLVDEAIIEQRRKEPSRTLEDYLSARKQKG